MVFSSLDWSRREKIAAGVKIGMRAGMSAHHTRGFAVTKTAATSMAHTEQIRTAILRAQVGSGNVRTKDSSSKRQAWPKFAGCSRAEESGMSLAD